LVGVRFLFDGVTVRYFRADQLKMATPAVNLTGESIRPHTPETGAINRLNLIFWRQFQIWDRIRLVPDSGAD